MNNTKLRWRDLCRNRCPKCSKELDVESDPKMMMCTISCGFMIGIDKMKLICFTQAKKKLEYEPSVDNFSALQHLGEHEKERGEDDCHVI